MTEPAKESTPAAHRTLSDQAYTRLRHDVIHGDFAPGSKLGIEQLRAAYAVGATPLREALHRLSAEGFVVVEGQRGFRVADISARELRELTELRIAIEAAAAKQVLEDLSLPFRPKRRSKGSIAREAGIEPLADRLFGDPRLDPTGE